MYIVAPNVKGKGYSYQGTKDLMLYRDGKYYFVKYVNDDKDGLLATSQQKYADGVLNGYENGTVYIENAVKLWQFIIVVLQLQMMIILSVS